MPPARWRQAATRPRPPADDSPRTRLLDSAVPRAWHALALGVLLLLLVAPPAPSTPRRGGSARLARDLSSELSAAASSFARVTVRPHASNVTLVSAWFPLGSSSKHAESEYAEWMARFLRVRAPMVIFTTAEGRQAIRALRRPELPIHFEVFDDVWALPSAVPIIEAYVAQQSLDLDADIHSPALYALWNAKTSLVAAAIEANVFASKVFFWVDLGSWRVSDFEDWPDEHRVHRLFSARPCRMLFELAAPLQPWANLSQPLRGLVYAGTFFGGAIPAWAWWHREYRRLHDEWLAQRLFVGNDQFVINSVATRNLRRIMMLDTRSLPDSCGPFMWSPYFYFQRWLARPADGRLEHVNDSVQLDWRHCPDRRVILPLGEATGPEQGCDAEEWLLPPLPSPPPLPLDGNASAAAAALAARKAALERLRSEQEAQLPRGIPHHAVMWPR